MRMKNLIYPKFDGKYFFLVRIGGPGVGNLLFPWARAMVIKKNNPDFKYVPPVWGQLKLGPLIRGESDLRHYIGQFKIRTINELFLGIISEYAFLAAIFKYDKVVTVSGLGDYFTPLIGNSKYIKTELEKIVSDKILEAAKRSNKSNRVIAVHVRLGDFGEVNDKLLREGADNIRLPLQWYISIVKEIEKLSPNFFEYVIYSDASKESLSDLLELPNVIFPKSAHALADILAISNSSAVVGSASTFSRWGCFLGGCPSIWYPGQLKYRFCESLGEEIEYDYDPDQIAPWLNEVKRRIKS